MSFDAPHGVRYAVSRRAARLPPSIGRDGEMVRWLIGFVVALAIGAGAWFVFKSDRSASTDEVVTLSVHHFLSPASDAHRLLIEPWAQRLQEQSGGRIKVEIFPAMALGGKPSELYRQVRDGTADVVWTLTGYTPGVFPRAEVFELPSVHQGSAQVTTQAIQDRFDLIAEDFAQVHPLLIHVHAGNALQMIDRRVTHPRDLAGLKLRTPSRTGVWLIEALKAEPVAMPVPELPQALAKRVVDGALIPFQIMRPFRLQEVVGVSVEGAGAERFGTSVYMFAMNKERYEALPRDLQQIIDANSGAALAQQLGDTWDRVESAGKDLQRQSGGEIIEFDGEAMQRFQEIAQQVVDRWIDESRSEGIDGAGLVSAARAAIVSAAGQ
ncbi:MAG: TRAP transporter substrate-binding protein [Neomegalonema sp.]|nr:TRAP transporter substrate-binding protein [Neomegalonema sp.]